MGRKQLFVSRKVSHIFLSTHFQPFLCIILSLTVTESIWQQFSAAFSTPKSCHLPAGSIATDARQKQFTRDEKWSHREKKEIPEKNRPEEIVAQNSLENPFARCWWTSNAMDDMLQKKNIIISWKLWNLDFERRKTQCRAISRCENGISMIFHRSKLHVFVLRTRVDPCAFCMTSLSLLIAVNYRPTADRKQKKKLFRIDDSNR